MKEEFEFNQSNNLLNDFLGQENDDKTAIINEDPDKIEIIEPIKEKDKDLDSSLEITNKLPDDLVTEEEEEEIESVKSSESQEGSYSFKALAEYLAEQGIVQYEASDDLEDTPDLLSNSVQHTINSKIEEYKESLPDKAKQIVEFLEKGGDLDDYLNKVTKPFDFKSIDLTSESDQEIVVRENLKLQGYEYSEIEETIQDYKDSLILDKQAKLAEKQVKKFYDKQEQSVIAEQEAIREQQLEQHKNYISTISNTIDTAEILAGLPLDSKSKLEFKKYLLQVDKDGMTQYTKEVSEDPVKTQLELAYLKFMKYDFSKAMKKGETLATQKIKNIFKQTEKSVQGKSVNETGKISDLSAFEQFRGK